MRIRQTWENLKKIDFNKLIKTLFVWYMIIIILDCGTTIYGFEVFGAENCSFRTNETLICEGNPHIYNSECAIFHLFAMIGIACILKYFGEFNYSNSFIRFIAITLSITGLEFLVGLTAYAVINNMGLYFLYI